MFLIAVKTALWPFEFLEKIAKFVCVFTLCESAIYLLVIDIRIV